MPAVALPDSADAHPFLIDGARCWTIGEIRREPAIDLSSVRAGDVVALIGDFDAVTLSSFLALAARNAIVMPLTRDTAVQHPYFFAAGGAGFRLENGRLQRLDSAADHPLKAQLREQAHGGLILFTSGTTGSPKAILHDLSHFLARYQTKRPALRTLSFLLFDHIGGLNTVFHTLFNCGTLVRAGSRSPADVTAAIARHAIELLPTSPSFLRLWLMSGALDEGADRLKIVTYGTERMDEGTLTRIAAALPHVDFRQTYGMSELGILRVRSRARDSTWMKIGGEGVETKIEGDQLWVRAEHRMLGYLNSPDPFDRAGWYPTGDRIAEEEGWIRILGRNDELINVGGVKIMPEQLETVGLSHPDMMHCHAVGIANPILGQHIEIQCELVPGAKADVPTLRRHFAARLPPELRPHRIRIADIPMSHRFKRS